MVRLCCCACHAHTSHAELKAADVRNPADAALACDACRKEHCDALLSLRLANDPEPEERLPSIAEFLLDNGEGAEA